MAVPPIDWNAGGNVSLGDLYKGVQMRNDTRRANAYELMAGTQVEAMEAKAQQERVKAAAEWTTRAGSAVLSAPPQDRPRLYQMALEEGQRLGFDMSGLPPQYDRGVEDRIRFSVAQAQRIGGRQRAPAGGGGAGYTLDAPYQPAGAEPQQPAGAEPQQPVAPQPAAPMVAPRPQQTPQPQATTGGTQPMGPVTAPAITSTQDFAITPNPQPDTFGPRATVAIPPAAPGAPPPRPPAQPPMAAAKPPAAPMRDDAGQDAPPQPQGGFAMQPGDRIVRGKNGAPRAVNGQIEVRDAQGQTQFRPPIKVAPPPAPPKPPKEKPLSEPARKNLKEVGGTTGAMVDLIGTFKDDYGGYRGDLFADAAMEWRSRFKGDTAPADWWRLYQGQKNAIRNDLFGAALTPAEKAEFEKADIRPALRPEVIRKNLQDRTRILLTGLSRIASSMRADGYNQEAIEAAIGMRLDMLPPAVNDTPELRARVGRILGTGGGAGTPPAGGPSAPAAPAPGGAAARRLRFNPETGELE